jgi:outer membrane protein TolC
MMGEARTLWVKCPCVAALAIALLFTPRSGLGQPASEIAGAPAALPALKLPPLPAGAQSLVPTDRAIILKEAIALALQHQPLLAQADAAAAAAASRTQQAVSGLRPTLSISSQYTRSGPEQAGAAGAGSSGSAYTTGLSAEQLLYDFGKSRSRVSQARSLEGSAHQAFAQTRQDAIAQVKQAYYRFLQDQRLVVVQRRNVSDQQAHLTLARARFQVGTAPRADVIKAETAVAEAILSLSTAENAAALSRINLNLAMGIDVRAPTRIEEADEPAPKIADQASLVETALAKRPDYTQARFNLEAAKVAVRLARTGNRPGVYAAATQGLRGNSFPPSDSSWTYGVNVQWPLFDAGLTAGKVREAQANLRSAEASLRQAEQTVASEVVQAYLNLQTAEQQVTVAKAEVANAEESLRVATGRYETGVAIYIEVLDAQRDLLTAETNQVNSLHNLSTARAALKRALGLEEGQ